MIDIEGADKKVKQVDGLLTSITNLIKKHWLILTVIIIGLLAYWISTNPDAPENPKTVIDSVSTDRPVDQDILQDTTTVYETDSAIMAQSAADTIH